MHCEAAPRLIWRLQAPLMALELRVELVPARLPASQCASASSIVCLSSHLEGLQRLRVAW